MAALAPGGWGCRKVQSIKARPDWWGGSLGEGIPEWGEGSSSESIEGEGRGETNKDLCVQKLPTPQLSVFITPLL